MSEEVMDESLKTIVKGAGIVFFGLIVSKVLTYGFIVFVARYFGSADYGLFSLGLAILSLFMMVVLLGTQNGVIRYTSHYLAKKNEKGVRSVILSTIKMVLPFSLLLSFVMFISSEFMAVNIFHEPRLTGIFIVLSFSIPFSAMFGIFTSVFVGFKRIKYQVYSESVFIKLMILVLTVSFGLLGFGVLGMVVYISSHFLTTFGQSYILTS